MSLKNLLLKLRQPFISTAAISKAESDNQYSPPKLIVSLTSYRPRFRTLKPTIETLLNQSLKPDLVILWVDSNSIESIPPNIAKLKDHGLVIESCEDCRSYTKIVPCLEKFPEATIVTADDDILYPEDWLKTLHEEHLLHPHDIICHRARFICYLPNGEINKYTLWANVSESLSSPLLFPLGVGGVLYPPHSLHPDAIRREIFLELCPHGDDIWLKTMSLLQKTNCRKIDVYKKNFKQAEGSQAVNLKSANVYGQNDLQIKRVFSQYGIEELIKQQFM